LVHLIGISHSFQLRAVKPFRDGGLDIAGSGHIACQFERYLNEVVEQLKPRAICEEYSNAKLLGQLEIDEQAYLVAQRVCVAHGLQHVFCDPDYSERIVLYSAHGATEEHDELNGYPIREGEWLRRLLPQVAKGDVLFLCGANHVATFSHRLAAASIGASVVCKDFEQTNGASVQ
jgi:hypothetical protein